MSCSQKLQHFLATYRGSRTHMHIWVGPRIVLTTGKLEPNCRWISDCVICRIWCHIPVIRSSYRQYQARFKRIPVAVNGITLISTVIIGCSTVYPPITIQFPVCVKNIRSRVLGPGGNGISGRARVINSFGRCQGTGWFRKVPIALLLVRHRGWSIVIHKNCRILCSVLHCFVGGIGRFHFGGGAIWRSLRTCKRYLTYCFRERCLLFGPIHYPSF